MTTKIAAVIEVVATHAGVTADDVLGSDRSWAVSLARAVAMYCARHHVTPRPSYPTIGRAFGRDHRTVMVALARLERRKAAVPWLDAAITAAGAAAVAAQEATVQTHKERTSLTALSAGCFRSDLSAPSARTGEAHP